MNYWFYIVCVYRKVLFENMYFYYTLIVRTIKNENVITAGYWVLFENH